MRKSLFILLSIIILLAFAGNSLAKNTYGLGFIFVEPTGLSGKMALKKGQALAAALGWSSQKGNNAVIQADYLFWSVPIYQSGLSTFSFYVGGGGRMKFNHEPDLGLRLPIGFDFVSRKAPLNLFFELVPIINLTESTHFDLKAAVGIRYLFER